MAKSEYIAALDIGTTKVCCFIAEKDSGDRIQVTGIGYHASEGPAAGSIVDMQAAEQSVLAAVHAAEQMAGNDDPRSHCERFRWRADQRVCRYRYGIDEPSRRRPRTRTLV